MAFAPLFVWIGVIFFLSSPQGSMSQTSLFIRPVLQFLFPAAPEETISVYHTYIRKTAHFTEYAVLAFLAFRSLVMTFLSIDNLKYIFPLVLVVSISSLDEFNQSFEISRTSSFRDVLLDILGGATMLVFLWFIKQPQVKEFPPQMEE